MYLLVAVVAVVVLHIVVYVGLKWLINYEANKL